MIESCFDDLICDFPDVVEGAMEFGLIRGLRLRDQGGRSAVQVAKEVAADSLGRGAFIRASHDVIMVKPPIVISMDELFEDFRRPHWAIEIVVAAS